MKPACNAGVPRTLLASGAAAFVSAATALLPASVPAVDPSEDFIVESGADVTMSAEQSAKYYGKVRVDGNLTIDGADRGLTNAAAVFIGGEASGPVCVTVTNGAKWAMKDSQTVTFSRYGGTITVSQPAPGTFGWGTQIDVPWSEVKVYDYALATVGLNSLAVIGPDAIPDSDGGMDILRLLPNGTAGFRNVKNENTAVDARILFEGGLLWVQNNSTTRFTAGEGAKIILESVDGNPICLRSIAGDFSLFTGAGTLETRGDGDFVLHHERDASDLRTITVSEGDGEIIWGHKGKTCFRGLATWKMGSDNVLPYGPDAGPVVFDCIGFNTSGRPPMTFDLNGKRVTVNVLGLEGSYKNRCIVTNSSPSSATLVLNVETNAVLSGLIDAAFNFAVNASSNIRLAKTGAGTLTVDKALPFGGIDILEGTVIGTKDLATGDFALTNGVTAMLKSPYARDGNYSAGFAAERLVVNAGDGVAVLSNVWQQSVRVMSGTARIDNVPERIATAETSWRPAESRIDAVDVDGGVLEIARGRLAATNISVAAGAKMHIRGGAGVTNRVEFRKPSLTDRYYRFIFKRTRIKNRSTENPYRFGLGKLILRAEDGSGELSMVKNGVASPYSYNATAAAATDLAAGEYMWECPAGLEFVTGNDGNTACWYSADGLTSLSNKLCSVVMTTGARQDVPDTWKTVTVRLRDEAVVPIVGYVFWQDWKADRLLSWEVQAGSDGVNWRTVDEGGRADVYANTANNPEELIDGYGWINKSEPFGWRCLNDDAVFACEGAVQVDEGGVLDLSCVPDENVTIRSIAVDAASGAGRIVKFRPAVGGELLLTGLGPSVGRRYTLPLEVSSVVDADNLSTWGVCVDGEPVRGGRVEWAGGSIRAVLRTHGLAFTVR